MLARAAKEALLLSLQLALAVPRLSGTRSSGDILAKDAAALTALPVPGIGGQAWWGCGGGAGSVRCSRALAEALQGPTWVGWEWWSSRLREGCISLQASLSVSSVAESLQGKRGHGSGVKGVGPPPGPYSPAQWSELSGGRDLPHWMVVATCGENGDSVSLCMRLPVLNKSNKLDVNIYHLSGSCPPSLSTWGWAHSMEGDLRSSPSLSQLPLLHPPPPKW